MYYIIIYIKSILCMYTICIIHTLYIEYNIVHINVYPYVMYISLQYMYKWMNKIIGVKQQCLKFLIVCK